VKISNGMQRVSERGSVTQATRLPLHVQISEMLAREINAGLLLDGARLPPERTLAAQLGIAVGTLRKALAELHAQGLLERIHGSGNYVRNNDGANTIYSLFRLELLKGGGLPTATVLSVRRVKKSESLPSFGKSESAYRIRRIRRLDGIKAAIEEIWLDDTYADSVNKSDLSESMYHYYKDSLGLWIANAEDKLSVRHLPNWAPGKEDDADTAWGFVERLSWDNEGVAVEYSRTWFDPKTTRYVARWK
jgi:GntR family transcriptional regulator